MLTLVYIFPDSHMILKSIYVGTLVYNGKDLEYTSCFVEPSECKHKYGETSVKCELKI